MEQESEKTSVTVSIKGGLIWWQLVVGPDGETSIEQVLSAETSGIGSAKTDSDTYTSFKFGAEKWSTSPQQYAQNDGMLAFAKNLGVKTKEIDEFKLTAQIAEASGKTYGFPLGFREGVHLDDGFHLVIYDEDDVAQRVGFVRVSKTADNVNDPSSYTSAKQLLGKKMGVGDVVMENPKPGIDMKVKLAMISGLTVPQEYIPSNRYEFLPSQIDESNQLLDEDVSSGFGADIYFSYNLAPIIGVSQTFLDVNTTFAFPIPDFNDNLDDIPTVLPFLLSAYTGVSKKLWFGSSNLGVFAGAGMESLNIGGKIPEISSGSVEFIDFVYSVRAIAFKFATDFEKLLTPDLSINLGFQYKFALPPMNLGITIDGEEVASYTGIEVIDLYSDLNLSGMGFNLGINYALGELPFNLFGFLDPMKKH